MTNNSIVLHANTFCCTAEKYAYITTFINSVSSKSLWIRPKPGAVNSVVGSGMCLICRCLLLHTGRLYENERICRVATENYEG